MKLTVNGVEKEVDDNLTVLDFLIRHGLDPDKVVVEYNKDILKREDWCNTVMKDNDKLEVLNFVGGG